MANMATSSSSISQADTVSVDLTNVGPPPVNTGYENKAPPSPDAFQFVPQNIGGRSTFIRLETRVSVTDSDTDTV